MSPLPRSQPAPATRQGGAVVRPIGFSGDDVALVAALQAGHPGARAALFDRYGTEVRRLVVHMVGPKEDVADLLHEIFIQAYLSVEGLREPRALRSWLLRVAVLTVRKYFRSRARRWWLRLWRDDEEAALHEPRALGTEGHLREASDATFRVLARLGEEERTVFTLRYLEGRELAEVASLTDLSLSTVKRRLERAEQHFRAMARGNPALRDWLGEPGS